MEKVTVKNLRTRFPSTYRSFFGRKSEYIVSRSGDTILLKQIRNKPWPSELPQSDQPASLEEIDRIVHKVRKRRTRKR